MHDKLRELKQQYEDVGVRLADPSTLADNKLYTALAKEHAELAPVVQLYDQLLDVQSEQEQARELIELAEDSEMRAMARQEVADLNNRIAELEDALKKSLIAKDPLDAKNVILEIRAGTGGDEASLFCGDLFAMYSRYTTRMNWQMEIISASEGTVGGFKEIVAIINGQDVYAHLKFEAGTHRVQRVPSTESQGRIHTSACTVAILPEALDVDVDINDADLKIDTYRASGAGGQHVNKTDSAVRITHIPTGIVVACQDERSQHKNKAKALKVLRSKILDAEQAKIDSERAETRKLMVGSGDRSERIRTYNFPQNRITDHRIALTLYSLDQMLESGDISTLVEALRAAQQLEDLQQQNLE